MKNIARIIIIIGLAFPIFFISCLEEDIVENPVINDVRMYRETAEGDVLLTEIVAKQKIKILVDTNADIITIWPGGIRNIMKKANSTADSTDMFGNPVLIASDHFSDYGLTKASGLKTTLSDAGWYATYTYPNAGTYTLTVVATNHGYDGPDFRREVKEFNVTVK